MPQILLIEDDPAIRESLVYLLRDEGYQAQEAVTLDVALDLIDRFTFDLVLTDLLDHDPDQPLASAIALRDRAAPTPVAILSAWPTITTTPEAAEFAFVMSKPFDLDELLTTIAAALHTRLSPEEEARALVVRQYFDALSTSDWDALVSICTDDVIYVLPGNSALSATVQGKSAFQAYSESVFAHFPAAHFEPVSIYATPSGMAARYQVRWLGNEHQEQQQAGAVVFQFSGLLIRRIGIQLANEQLRQLLETSS